jgi:hypothetical protein
MMTVAQMKFAIVQKHGQKMLDELLRQCDGSSTDLDCAMERYMRWHARSPEMWAPLPDVDGIRMAHGISVDVWNARCLTCKHWQPVDGESKPTAVRRQDMFGVCQELGRGDAIAHPPVPGIQLVGHRPGGEARYRVAASFTCAMHEMDPQLRRHVDVVPLEPTQKAGPT